MTYTDEELISELHRFYDENDKVPTQLDMTTKNGYPSYGTYVGHFGTFNNVLRLVGFEVNTTHEKRIGLETCCKCNNYLKQNQHYYTKGLLEGEVMCHSCYGKSMSDYKNGKLNKESTIGKATISEQVIKNVLNLEERHDCNFACGFKHPVDLYHKEKYKYINVKDSKLHCSITQSSHWKFNLSQKVIPDTYIMVGFDEDRKNISHVWITDAIDDLTYNEKKGRPLSSKTITNVYESLTKARAWEVDSKPYNDMLHLMSQKRKDNNGEKCFLRNDDLMW